MGDLTGQVALITGGAGGIGRAFCIALLQRGAKVCVTDYNRKQGEMVLAELSDKFGSKNVCFCQCDVSKVQELEETFKHTISTFGGLDIVCNNAGLMDESKIQSMIDVNLGAIIQGTLLGIKYMRRDRGGRGGVVVNSSSGAGVLPFAPAAVYSATKHGVVGFSRSIALQRDRQQTGVRINCICPGYTDTNMTKLSPDSKSVSDIDHFYDLGKGFKLFRPEQIADQLMPLIENTKLNGQVLLVGHEGPRILKLPYYYDDIESKL